MCHNIAIGRLLGLAVTVALIVCVFRVVQPVLSARAETDDLACTLAPTRAVSGFPVAVERLLRRVRMPPERMRALPRVQQDLEQVLQLHWPGCQLVPFGSISTELALVQSDVDLVILLPNQIDTSLGHVITETASVMQKHPRLFHEIRAVNATTPIVKATHVPTGFSVDISAKENGVMNSRLLRYLLGLDERAMALALIAKYWARLHRITGTGLLPSYGMITMVIFYLQQKYILPTIASLQTNADNIVINNYNMDFTAEKFETRNNESLCTLLGGFFRYYTDFDFSKYMVCPFVGRPVEIDLFRNVENVPEEFSMYKTNVGSNITMPIRIRPAVIQDYFDHSNNLALHLVLNPNSTFVTRFQYAAMKFQGNCIDFLEMILTV